MSQSTKRGPQTILSIVFPIAIIAAVSAACASQPTQQAAAGSQPAGHGGHSADHAAVAAQPAPAATQPVSGSDAALQLEALLGQHSVVAADMMRGRLRNDEDFAQAANTALGRNTDALVELVRALFGDQAAEQYKTLWTSHVTALFNYARGLAGKDAALQEQAKTSLTSFEGDLASFFSSASNGRLPLDAAQQAMLTHIDHLLHQADAYAAGDYATANKLYRESYLHTYNVGKALAGALLPADQVGFLQDPAWQLHSELSRLLGEHVALAVAVTRAAVTNAPDFDSAAETLNANTADLTAAIDSLFGKQAADTFMSLWADHLENIVLYTTGLATDDAQRRAEAVNKLHDFERKFAEFLQAATGSQMKTDDLANALLQHDQLLLQQVDAFAAKDYTRAHDIAFTTYQHMGEVGGALATAFSVERSKSAPAGGPQTGGGGTAGDEGPR